MLGGVGEKGVFWEEAVLSPEQHKGRGWPCFYTAQCHHLGVRAAAQRPVQHGLLLPSACLGQLGSTVLLQAGRSPEQGR